MGQRSIQGILFDNDGTLVDTYNLILRSFDYATRSVLGHTLPASVVMKKVGQPLVTQIADLSDDAVERQALWDAYQEYNQSHHDDEVHLFPEVIPVLEQLRGAGFSLGVVTSKRHVMCQRGLDITGISDYFSCLIGKEDCTAFKPAPGPVVAGAAALGLDTSACLYIGDSPYDMESGKAAGTRTIAALWGMFQPSELAACHPDAVCETFSELPRAIRHLGN
ncbi:MAG: HAD family hydrolase [Eggerthellaceae bacterium]|jgi:pyrophosphatase PpaX